MCQTSIHRDGGNRWDRTEKSLKMGFNPSFFGVMSKQNSLRRQDCRRFNTNGFKLRERRQ